jgi:DNA-binding transcriptional ArsR family regulator
MRRFHHPPITAVALTQVLHALSDPVRLEIVRTLARGGEKTCAELDGGRPKSSMSHHFRVLRECGVVRTRNEGVTHFNSVRVEELEKRFPGLLKAILAVKGGLT